MSYVRCSILGSAPGGEVWSINPVYDPTGEFPGGVDQTKLDAAVVAINAISLPAALGPQLSTELAVTGVRLEVREDANDNLIALSQGSRTVPYTGSGAPKLTAQSATVISLRTNTPGPTGRGRLYFPAVGVTINTQLRQATPTPLSLATDMASYLMSIRTALAASFPTIGFDLAVRSRTTKTTPHVVRLQVGNVPDTQRRRRDAYTEAYVSVNVP